MADNREKAKAQEVEAVENTSREDNTIDNGASEPRPHVSFKTKMAILVRRFPSRPPVGYLSDLIFHLAKG